jgi:thioredoxin-related protein
MINNSRQILIINLAYVLAFLIIHNYVTNVLVAQSCYNFQVLSNAIQYLVATLLFRLVFSAHTARIKGFILFEVCIVITVIIAGIASHDDESDIFFPEYFPLYFLINSIVNWLIFRANKTYYPLIAGVVAVAWLSDYFYLPKISKEDSEYAARSFIRSKIDSFTSIDINYRQSVIPNNRKRNIIIFVSYLECIPCRLMASFMEEACKTFKSQDVDIIKINPVDDLLHIKEMEDTAIKKSCLRTLFPIDKDRFKHTLSIQGYPLLLIAKGNGQIIYAHYGYNPREHDILLGEIGKIIKSQ